ncbi:magnesium transporter MgtC [Candidatus Parcubacteria bacterium]|nr:MAG: magnesium transporter MgtC [Candidatus Parcubacteria bacterium]
MEYEIYFYFILQLLLAGLLGGVLGWQREHIGKPAGPRTYALVCIGSALFTIMSIKGFGELEPARIAAQILTGIGFLGAGIIMHKEGGVVVGLTTAAGLWVIAAIGMAIGLGWFWQAVIATLIILAIMSVDDNIITKPKKKKRK